MGRRRHYTPNYNYDLQQNIESAIADVKARGSKIIWSIHLGSRLYKRVVENNLYTEQIGRRFYFEGIEIVEDRTDPDKFELVV